MKCPNCNEEPPESLDFGDYVLIQQKRYCVENEMYLHKVITKLRSNSYVDVPVQTPSTETIHDDVVDVISCICCGIDETRVRKYRLCDVKPPKGFNVP